MNPSTRLQTPEQSVLEALKEGMENKYSTIIIHISDGKIVFLEVSKKVKF